MMSDNKAFNFAYFEPAELKTTEVSFYECPSVHLDMINDTVRTSFYEKAINEVVKEGDIVTDIGTGTGILALMAARAGAKKVYALERSKISEWAKKIIEENGFTDRIEILNIDSRELKLDKKVDVIVSECIGHLGLDENMFDAVIDVRERLLKPGGKIIPAGLKMYVSLANDLDIYKKLIDFWNNALYGFKFSVMTKAAQNQIYIVEANKNAIVSSPVLLYDFDTYKAKETSLKTTVELNVNKKVVINGFYTWFDAKLSEETHILTDPFSEPTHWKQCFMPAPHPVEVLPSDRLEFEFRQVEYKQEENKDKLSFTWGVIKNGKRLFQFSSSI